MNARSLQPSVGRVPRTIYSLSSEDIDHVGKGRCSGLRSRFAGTTTDHRECSQLRDSAGCSPDFPSVSWTGLLCHAGCSRAETIDAWRQPGIGSLLQSSFDVLLKLHDMLLNHSLSLLGVTLLQRRQNVTVLLDGVSHLLEATEDEIPKSEA